MANSINRIIETSEAKRKAVVERAYLHFYNNSLLEKGLITPDQHRKMRIYINGRKPSMER